jgi:sphingolipid delta-4 desaturase
MRTQTSFAVVDYPEPHLERTRQILSRHPEMKSLFGNTPSTALFVVGIVALQIAVAWMVHDQPWWVILAAAWTVGAVANHALWTLIHDATHNLIFKGSVANKVMAMVANLPIVFPSAITFRTYHLQHHRYQGILNKDADLAIPAEAWLAGRNPVGKALWFLLFPFFQPFRVRKLDIDFMDRWMVVNFAVEVAFLAGIYAVMGGNALWYLFGASCFSVGLHPVGARWIQEHYTVKPDQETYSYYGPFNRVAFNVGYHNEHHDLMRVPWTRLPKLRAMAPEMYDTIHYHTSWTRLLVRFVMDPKIGLHSRVVRSPAPQGAEATVEQEVSALLPSA